MPRDSKTLNPIQLEVVTMGLAVVAGPAFVITGNNIDGLVLRSAAVAYILYCGIAVPVLILVAGRLRYWVWQVAIFSSSLAILGDNLRLNAIRWNDSTELARTFLALWILGTISSLPLPAFMFLRSLPLRLRLLGGVLTLFVALAGWLFLNKLAR